MNAYALRRLAQMIPTLILVTFIVFVLFSVIPGSVVSAGGGDQFDPQMAARLTREFGLDRPLLVRFFDFIRHLAVGDFGRSLSTRQPVIELLGPRLWPSLELAIAAMAVAIAVGVPLGFLSGLYRGSWIDGVSTLVSVTGLSMPQFWLGLLLIYLFAVWLGWLPATGYGHGGLANLVLPALSLGLTFMALIARTTRAAVIDIMRSDYIRTARSKGLSRAVIYGKHVLRNAMTLILTTVGLQFGAIMGKAIIIEKLFAWPGIGSLLIDSIFVRDLTTAQGCIVVMIVFFLLVNLAVDLLYSLIDPRIENA